LPLFTRSDHACSLAACRVTNMSLVPCLQRPILPLRELIAYNHLGYCNISLCVGNTVAHR